MSARLAPSDPSGAGADRRPATPHPVAVAGAVAAFAVAGLLHLVVAPEHLHEVPLLGIGMVLTAVVQLAAATAAVRSGRPWPVLAVGALVTVAAIAFYALTRTVDLPLMPGGHAHDGAAMSASVPGAVGDGVPRLPGSRTEGVGLLDAVCVAAELVAVVAASALLPGRVGALVARTSLVAALAVVAWRVLLG
ncbi:hypothetical protein GCM10009737_14710 [Nocardioides lentus]|uniref:Uncharacterized protein n=1 Tax=Nocardioides lentus TaxID=338077 RepID=A0ABP5AHZ7_9ACTN